MYPHTHIRTRIERTCTHATQTHTHTHTHTHIKISLSSSSIGERANRDTLSPALVSFYLSLLPPPSMAASSRALLCLLQGAGRHISGCVIFPPQQQALLSLPLFLYTEGLLELLWRVCCALDRAKRREFPPLSLFDHLFVLSEHLCPAACLPDQEWTWCGLFTWSGPAAYCSVLQDHLTVAPPRSVWPGKPCSKHGDDMRT